MNKFYAKFHVTLEKQKYTHENEYENDFGFSAVDEADIRKYETELQEQLVYHQKSSISEIQSLKDQLIKSKKQTQDLLNAIMPLLKNLQDNPERDYILWPNRAQKIDEFTKKLKAIAS